MRVLLVEPPVSRYDVGTGIVGLAEPLALECLAGALDGHEVQILDMRIEPALQEVLRDFRPHVVGCGGYTVGVASVRNVLQEAKQFDSKILTVAGGHHATIQPHDFNQEYIDAVVVGEGELTLRDLVSAFATGRFFYDIPGLGLRQNGQFILTADRPLADLDSFPFPARQLVRKYRNRYFRGKWQPIASMYTSRGCPYRCTFCAMWKVNRGKYRLRSPERIVEELKMVPEPYIDLVDDNTFENIRWALDLADRIQKAGIRKMYKVYSRADTIATHPEVVSRWKEIGLAIALVGFESFRDKELGSWHKQTSISVNENAFRVLKENDVEIAAYFVIDPEYAEADFQSLKDYIDRWELFHPVFTILTPFPGTDLFNAEQHRIANPNYELFDFFHAVLPTRLTGTRFAEMFVDLYKYAYSFSRAMKHMKRQRFFGVSLKQLVLKKRFFAQLDNLKRLPYS